jgi:hypothetical protein
VEADPSGGQSGDLQRPLTGVVRAARWLPAAELVATLEGDYTIGLTVSDGVETSESPKGPAHRDLRAPGALNRGSRRLRLVKPEGRSAARRDSGTRTIGVTQVTTPRHRRRHKSSTAAPLRCPATCRPCSPGPWWRTRPPQRRPVEPHRRRSPPRQARRRSFGGRLHHRPHRERRDSASRPPSKPCSPARGPRRPEPRPERVVTPSGSSESRRVWRSQAATTTAKRSPRRGRRGARGAPTDRFGVRLPSPALGAQHVQPHPHPRRTNPGAGPRRRGRGLGRAARLGGRPRAHALPRPRGGHS